PHAGSQNQAQLPWAARPAKFHTQREQFRFLRKPPAISLMASPYNPLTAEPSLVPRTDGRGICEPTALVSALTPRRWHPGRRNQRHLFLPFRLEPNHSGSRSTRFL